MNQRQKHFRLFLALLSLALIVGACSSDSPTEPSPAPPPAPGGGGGGQFSIVITADPPTLQVGGNEATTIRVRVRRLDNNQVPPNGTSIVVSTNLGSFNNLGSGIQQVVGTLLSGEVQLLLFPPSDEGGTAVIQAQLEGSVGQLAVQIQGDAAFFLSFVQPNVGNPGGGEEVTITGGGFVEPVRVTFDGQVAQVLNVTFNTIRAVSPASVVAVPTNSTRSVPVTVTVNANQAGQASDTLVGGFTYARGGSIQQPVITSVSPRTGTNDGGTPVTISGEGFQSPVQVLFGQGLTPTTFQGVEATVQSVSENQIVVVTPPARAFGQNNLNQTVNILVRNLGNGFAGIEPSAFQYGTPVLITSFAPGQVSSSGGTVVTIFGQGFDEPVAVGLADIGQTVLSVTGTEILVRTVAVEIDNCTDVAGPISVVNIESGDGASIPGPFVFRAPQPVIAGVQPNFGGEVGNTQVTITGVNFVPPLRVLFGDQAGTVISVSPDGTSIVVRTPAFSGPFNTQACDDNNDGTVGERFVNTAVGVQVINLGTDCFDEFTGGFTFRPFDLSCRGDQAPAPPVLPQCQDSIDNDGDGFTDFGSDPECTTPDDNNEAA
jgi:hypothetical protein